MVLAEVAKNVDCFKYAPVMAHTLECPSTLDPKGPSVLLEFESLPKRALATLLYGRIFLLQPVKHRLGLLSRGRVGLGLFSRRLLMLTRRNRYERSETGVDTTGLLQEQGSARAAWLAPREWRRGSVSKLGSLQGVTVAIDDVPRRMVEAGALFAARKRCGVVASVMNRPLAGIR